MWKGKGQTKRKKKRMKIPFAVISVGVVGCCSSARRATPARPLLGYNAMRHRLVVVITPTTQYFVCKNSRHGLHLCQREGEGRRGSDGRRSGGVKVMFEYLLQGVGEGVIRGLQPFSCRRPSADR